MMIRVLKLNKKYIHTISYLLMPIISYLLSTRLTNALLQPILTLGKTHASSKLVKLILRYTESCFFETTLFLTIFALIFFMLSFTYSTILNNNFSDDDPK